MADKIREVTEGLSELETPVHMVRNLALAIRMREPSKNI